MDSFKRYLKLYGLPQSVYLDKHATYKSNARSTIEEELGGIKPKSQFERALEELEVQVIHAHSPQAKGRVENLFRTFQDRLVKELRLQNARTREEANGCLLKYLQSHNRRFSRVPRYPENLHRSVPQGVDLNRILSIRIKRFLRNDQTIQHEGRTYLVEDRFRQKRPKWIEIERRLSGKLYLMDSDRPLSYREVCKQNLITKPINPHKQQKRVSTKPSPDHPWQKPFKTQRGSYYQKLVA